MKIRVTMEAEVQDLPPFQATPAGLENIYHVVRNISIHPIEKLMELHAKKDEDLHGSEDKVKLRAALEKSYRQEKELTQRLVETIKVEEIKP